MLSFAVGGKIIHFAERLVMALADIELIAPEPEAEVSTSNHFAIPMDKPSR